MATALLWDFPWSEIHGKRGQGHFFVIIFLSPSCFWLCNPMDCSTPGLPVPYYLPEFSQVHVIESVIPSRHVILCHPFLLLPSIFPSIRIFSNESVTQNRWSKLSPRVSQESSSHHSSKASMFWCSGFFMVQLSHLYLTTGKTIALTIWTFVDKVTSLLFNTLSRFLIAFLPRCNHLISWLQSPSAVILELQRRKSVTTSTFSPSVCHPFSRRSFQPRDQTCISCFSGQLFIVWVTREALRSFKYLLSWHDFKWYWPMDKDYSVFNPYYINKSLERVTGRKARGLQMEEIGCKCQTFLSLLSGRRKQTSDIFFLLYANIKGGFS